MRATACPDTSGRTPLLYCTACAPTSPASRARIRRSCARGLNSWLNPPQASRQPPSPRVLREAMAAFLCVGRPPTARATSRAACQPCMCEWPARVARPHRHSHTRPTAKYFEFSAPGIFRCKSRETCVNVRYMYEVFDDWWPVMRQFCDGNQRKVHVGHPHIMEAADICRTRCEGGERGR